MPTLQMAVATHALQFAFAHIQSLRVFFHFIFWSERAGLALVGSIQHDRGPQFSAGNCCPLFRLELRRGGLRRYNAAHASSLAGQPGRKRGRHLQRWTVYARADCYGMVRAYHVAPFGQTGFYVLMLLRLRQSGATFQDH